MFGFGTTQKQLNLGVPYPYIEAPDAVPDPGAMGLSLEKRVVFPYTSVLGSGSAYYKSAEPITEGLLALAPIGAPVTFGETTLDTFGIDPSQVGPWAG
jgi:hypothetical protein